MAKTEHLDLYVTPSSDTTTNVRDWFNEMAASDSNSNMMKIDAAHKELSNLVNQHTSALANLNQTTEGLTAQLTDLDSDLAFVDSTLDNVQAEVASVIRTIDSIVDHTTALQKQADDTNTELSKVQTDVEALSKTLDSANDVIETLQQADQTTNTSIERIDGAVESLQDSVTSLGNNLKTLEDSISDADNVVSSFQGQLDELTAKDITMSGQISAIQQQIESGNIGGSGGVAFSKMEYVISEEKLHIYDADGNDVVDPAYIPRGGGDSSGMIVILSNTTGKNTLAVATGKPVTISYSFSSIMSHNQAETGNGIAKYTLDGKVLSSGVNITQGEHEYAISADLLSVGTHTFSVEVDNQNSVVRTLFWTLVVKSISLTTEINEYAFYTGPVLATYTPVGSGVVKTTNFKLDNKLVHSATTAENNIPQTWTIPDQTHGAHTLEVWTEATIDGTYLKTDTLVYDLVWYDEDETSPIVSFKNFSAPVQHTSMTIPYMVYDPLNMVTSIELYSGDDFETPLDTLNVDRGVQHWYYTPQTAGTHKLSIKCGNVLETIEFSVEALNVPTKEIETNLLWKFDPTGRSNNEVNRDKWSYGDVSLSIPETFHWNRGGWGIDEDGYSCFTVPAGDTVTFTAKPFSTDWRTNGHNLKMIFKASNVCDYNAVVASCMYNDIGFQINAQSATFKTNGVTTEVPLCEEKYTEIEWNVTKAATEGSVGMTDYREIVTWLQGVPSAVVIYNSDDKFIQDAQNSVAITVGSADCDVHIYRIREYGSQLSDAQIFANWIVDSPSGAVMSTRYNRNLFMKDDGTIDPYLLATQHPNLRVLMLTCDQFTAGKDFPVEGCTLRHIMMSDAKKHCWTVENMIHEGQGTSSNEYGDSARNLDFDLDGCTIVFDDGTTATEYAMTDGSIPVNYFNLKVNVASSESANNACLTREYQRYNPYVRAARQNDDRVRDTMEFHPAVLFVKCAAEFGDDEFHFYAAGDLGNSKKNFEAQGLDSDNPKECIIELRNNTGVISKWQSDAWEAEPWDGDNGDLDFRFPNRKKATQGMKESFGRVLSWVVSTDTKQATNSALSSPVVYDGITYRTDSAAYRKAKFINEFDDYFISDSIMFYYLFTERHSMVDNRAKNTFWHTEDGLHWDLCFNYDNDTAMGNDNVGGLTLRYGLEDTDFIGDRAVYNAHDSVFFCNVRDFFPERLKEMFQRMEVAGAWDAQRLLDEMDAYQAIKPERVWIADMRRKYLRPYEEKGDGAKQFLPMLNGTKTLQRAQFELYQEKYCASKYMTAKCKEDQITVRSYMQSISTGIQPITLYLTMYADCYIAVQLGSNYVHQRVKGGVPTTITYTASSLNDTETYIYTASQVQAIGNLADLRIGYCDFSRATKLQSLIVSPYDENYTNTNLNEISLGNCALLKTLEICGCPNLTQALSFAGCPRLENLDLRNTAVSGVSFANGGYLVSAKLPETIKTITAIKLGDWSSLEMQGYQNIETLRLENCSNLNTRELVERAGKLSTLRLVEADWTLNNSQLLINLSKIGGLDALGKYTTQSVITGKALIHSLSPSRLNLLMNMYPELAISYNEVADEYVVRFWNDAVVVDEQVVEAGLPAEDPLDRIDTPMRESTPYLVYTFIGWDQTFLSILKDTDIHATYRADNRTYQVCWWNGADKLDEQTVVAGKSATYAGQALPATNSKVWVGFNLVADNVLNDLDIEASWIAIENPPSTKATDYDFVYSDNAQDKSGYTLGQFVGIIQSGRANDYFDEFDQIKIVVDETVDSEKEIIMSLHSTKHYKLEGSANFAKTTWYMIGLLSKMRVMNNNSINAGGYLASDLDKWLENDFFNALPYHWQSIIKPVEILATSGNGTSSISKGVRHLYLPSTVELGWDTESNIYKGEIAEGANELTFACYPVSNSQTANAQRQKGQFNNKGNPIQYWTRSAMTSTDNFIGITGGDWPGARTDWLYPSEANGVCIGMSI